MEINPGFVCIGAGNVATHLTSLFCNAGFVLEQVYSRTPGSASALASRFNSPCTTHLKDIVQPSGFYLVALPDKVIPQFLQDFKSSGKLVLHTAGSLGLDVFNNAFDKYGILYPLMTFSRSEPAPLEKFPVLIEASSQEALSETEAIARKISPMVMQTDTELRRWIHLAAVFASNFTNHMLTISNDLMNSRDLRFELLKPLINETLRKAYQGDPAKAQTGPAVRDDKLTMDKHIKMLEKKPHLQKIYTFTSRSIRSAKEKRNNSHE